MSVKTWIVALGLATCLLAQPAMARQAEDGVAAYNRGNYVTALKLMQPLATHGNAFAQSFLARMYYKGHGVPQDYAKAMKWYRLAAAQGSRAAQFSLGFMFYKGQGTPQDYAEAMKWFQLAAAQSYAHAQSFLGRMYYTGQGVPQDYAKAMQWYRLAATQGDPPAQYSLGVMFYKGHGMPQDYVQAYMWLGLASATYPASDTAHRNKTAKLRDLVFTKMTPVQIAKAQKLTKAWLLAHPKLSKP